MLLKTIPAALSNYFSFIFKYLPNEQKQNKHLSQKAIPAQERYSINTGINDHCKENISRHASNPESFFFFFFFIYFWLCWVFVSVRGLSLVAASGGHSSSRWAGLSLSRPLSLRSSGSSRAGSGAVAHRLSCSAACGIFPDQGSNPCPLNWQADSQSLRHQGSPQNHLFYTRF